jgi:hypothetical protein
LHSTTTPPDPEIRGLRGLRAKLWAFAQRDF